MKNSTDEFAARAAAALREVVSLPGACDRHRDSLTGLLDDRAMHRALTDAVEAAERAGAPIGLLFIDLDHFKNVNDRHGHVTGSRVLGQVAGFIDETAKKARGFAARYGGDEFVVVLPGADVDECLDNAERLRATLAAIIFAGGEPPERRPLVRVTCSIGVASVRPASSGDSAEAAGEGAATRLLRLADDAMYQAKHAGRNRVAAADTHAATAFSARVL
ncbi:MAG: GGDEF domain-containing protein [Holophagales bacterium]|nr:GGDEF domain-containing protein [Holophagales bacterium]